MWLSNNHFESQVSIPLFSTDEQKQEFIEAWLVLMQAGLNVGSMQREKEANAKTTQNTTTGC